MMIYTQKIYSKRANLYLGFAFTLSPKNGFKPCQLPVSNRQNLMKSLLTVKASDDEYFISDRTIKEFKNFLKFRENGYKK